MHRFKPIAKILGIIVALFLFYGVIYLAIYAFKLIPDKFSNLIGGAFVLLFIIVIVLSTYEIAKKYALSSDKSKWQQITKSIAIVLAVVFFRLLMLGSHIDPDESEFYGHNEIIEDYTPTLQEYIKHGLSALILLITPVLFGLHYGWKEKPLKKIEEEEKARRDAEMYIHFLKERASEMRAKREKP